MNIGLISPTYTPNLNGISILLKKLVSGFKDRGHNVYLVTAKVPGVEYADYILPVKSLPMPAGLVDDVRLPVLYGREAATFFRDHKVDIVNTHETVLGVNIALQLRKKDHIPHVHTYHTFLEAYHPGFPTKQLMRYLTKRTGNNSDVVISQTNKMKKYLESIGIKSRIEVVPGIPDLYHLGNTEKDPKLMQKYGIKESDFVFLTFGRIIKEKNIDRSILFVSELMRAHKDIKYLICGFGGEIEYLKKLSERLGVSEQVIFTGKYGQADLKGLANLGDCFLFSSRSDTQAITLIEAMICGLPVVSIDDDVVDYIIVDGKNGYKCRDTEFADRAGKVYADRNLLAKLSAGAAESGARLTGDDFVERYLEIYSSLLK